MYDLPVCPKFPLSSPSLIVHHLVVLRLLCADLRKKKENLIIVIIVCGSIKDIREHERRVAPLLYRAINYN